MAHVFVNYTGADVAWAEWIATVVEDAGCANIAAGLGTAYCGLTLAGMVSA